MSMLAAASVVASGTILPAAFDGYTGGSWPELLRTAPMTAKYIIVLYRMYGIYCLVFGLMGSAIAVTAFRRGDRWAWWTLLAGNTQWAAP